MSAALIAGDLHAMLEDGEIERAAYAAGDLRVALGAAPGSNVILALALSTLEEALELQRLPAARTATVQLIEILGAH